ncbi:hypothetical protein niasHT_031676 [Heterodera trifolii]|uniref:Uncharacterized protein n=1 Tax=Heterodera trifolii TaxID=157864 RepID=A0ABD2J466_9BILA
MGSSSSSSSSSSSYTSSSSSSSSSTFIKINFSSNDNGSSSGFIEEGCCSCPWSHLRSISITLLEYHFAGSDNSRSPIETAIGVGSSLLSSIVPLIDDKDKELKTIGKLLGITSVICGKVSKVSEGSTCWAVEVKYKCDQCGRVVHVTYGITPQGKFKRFGRMTNTANSTVWMVNRAYPDIERVYDDMHSNYNFGTTRAWAEEMIRRVLNQ